MNSHNTIIIHVQSICYGECPAIIWIKPDMYKISCWGHWSENCYKLRLLSCHGIECSETCWSTC